MIEGVFHLVCSNCLSNYNRYKHVKFLFKFFYWYLFNHVTYPSHWNSITFQIFEEESTFFILCENRVCFSLKWNNKNCQRQRASIQMKFDWSSKFWLSLFIQIYLCSIKDTGNFNSKIYKRKYIGKCNFLLSETKRKCTGT